MPAAAADLPPTSLADPGTSTRPRDARSLHLVLAAKGVAAYQERVPLQLLDFAYRYTSGILSDAQHLNAEGYVGVDGTTGPSGGSGGGGSGGGGGGGRGRGARHSLADEVTLSSVRMAAASRLGYQFAGPLPKEQMLELANERNRIKLPAVDKEAARFGVRLPPERFVLSGQGWQVPSEWDDEIGSEEEEAEDEDSAAAVPKANGNGDHKPDTDEDMVDEGEGRYEDVFGEEGGDEDKMED